MGAVLIEEQDWFAGGGDAGAGAGGLDFHEGDEAVDFRFGGSEFGEDAAEAERVFAESGAHEVVAGGGGVALVEDEVDDFEDGGEAGGELGAAGDLEGDVFVGEGAFGADDALGDGGFGGEEGAGDFVGGEAAEEAEGEGGAGLGGRMGWQAMKTRRRRSSLMVLSRVESRSGGFVRGLRVRGQVFVFALEARVAAEEIDGAAFGGGGEPCGGIIGNAGLRPLLECGDRSASCARSSARPTSRVRRVSPPMRRADSMRQTASMVRCVSLDMDNTLHHLQIATQVWRPGGAGNLSRLVVLFRAENLAISVSPSIPASISYKVP